MADRSRGRAELQAGLENMLRLAGLDEEIADLVAAAAMERYDEYMLIRPGGASNSEAGNTNTPPEPAE